jgi:hypothetical protein
VDQPPDEPHFPTSIPVVFLDVRGLIALAMQDSMLVPSVYFLGLMQPDEDADADEGEVEDDEPRCVPLSSLIEAARACDASEGGKMVWDAAHKAESLGKFVSRCRKKKAVHLDSVPPWLVGSLNTDALVNFGCTCIAAHKCFFYTGPVAGLCAGAGAGAARACSGTILFWCRIFSPMVWWS